MAWQGKGKGAGWARHAMCVSGLKPFFQYILPSSFFLLVCYLISLFYDISIISPAASD